MRRDRRIRRRGIGASRLGAALGSLLTVGAFVAAQAEGRVEDQGERCAARDSAWLPDPTDALEAPERLDDPDAASPGEGGDEAMVSAPRRAGASVAWGAAGTPVRRLWWEGDGLSLALTRAAGANDAGAGWRNGSVGIAAGAVSLRGTGLVGEIAGVARAARGAAPSSAPRELWRAAAGAGADLFGASLAWRRPPVRMADAPGRVSARIVGGSRRRAEGEALFAEVRADREQGGSLAIRGAVARAQEGAPVETFGGVRLERRAPGDRAAIEIAAGAGARIVSVEASARRDAWSATGRWSERVPSARPTTLDLEAAWSRRAAGARVRWRPWSARRTGTWSGDDGRAELDLRAGRAGPGAWTLRVGSRPRERDGTGGERFAIAELIAARERGRVLALTTAVRAVQAGGGWRLGRALGASLRMERPRRAFLDATVEGVRVEPGGAVSSRAYEAAGGGSIRSRTRSGVRVGARGWIARGAWRLGAAVDDEDDGTEPTDRGRATRASLWLTWNGDAGPP